MILKLKISGLTLIINFFFLPCIHASITPQDKHFSSATQENITTNLLTFNKLDWKPEYKLFFKKHTSTNYMPKNWYLRVVVPKPPSLKITLIEINEIIKLKPARKTYRDEIQIQNTNLLEPFEEVLDIQLIKNKLVYKWITGVYEDATYAVLYFKHKYLRARPRQYLKSINPIIMPPGHPSYPSGHSTQAHALAYALSQLFPDLEPVLVGIAHQIAINREIGGVHYRSDSVAGEILARQIIDLMSLSHKFKKDRFKAKQALQAEFTS